ncbi:MAG TPA: hypothetical protein VND98_08075 [Solirubrobacterales bacterium]|nr:hypothetical protein [Solirubrobacterales bacterium]
MKRRSAQALAGIACLAVAGMFSASALGVSVRLAGPGPELEGKITPAKLSKTAPKPVTLALEGTTSEPRATGEHPPVLKTISLQFDKSGAIFTKGLARCTIADLTRPDGPEHPCQKAIVGHGEAEIEVNFPEVPVFRTNGPMVIFNGAPRNGHPVLIYHLYADVPAPTTFLTSGVIDKNHGKFGTKTTIEIPTIVGGQGLLTSFEATISKTWTYKGKRVSLLTAKCPMGNLFAHDEFTFTNGTKASNEIAKSCS